MINYKRNRQTLDTLAPNTKVKAYQFYQYCLDHNIEILIYEGIRTLETQKKYVAEGKSQTLWSYHLVGQALDFVPIVNGKLDWGSYRKEPWISAIRYAKSIGFEWGGDWKGFVDMPHLQFNYKGYGSDTELEKPKIVHYVTGGFQDGSASAKEFEAFMKSKNWWYKKEEQA